MYKKFSNDFTRYRGKRKGFDIIGDIHGCYDELIELVEKLGYKKHKNYYRHPQGRMLVSVGDVADKGPKNLDCINFWINQIENKNGLWVYGNHCNKLFRYFLGNKVKVSHGLENTVSELQKLKEDEKIIFKYRFMEIYKRLSYYLMVDKDKLLVVHGGIKKEYIGKFNSRIRTMCIYGDVTGEFDENGKPIRRDWAAQYDGDVFIVYGHTAKKEAEIIKNTIDIDQGCVYGGMLTCFRYPESEIIQVKGKEYAIYNGSGDFDTD